MRYIERRAVWAPLGEVMHRIRTSLWAAAAIAGLSVCGAADATNFDFTFTQGSFTAAHGTITTADTANSDGGFDIVGISGTIYTNAIAGLASPGAELFPNSPDGQLLNSDGIFIDVPDGFLASPYNIFFGPEDFDDPVGHVDYQLGTPFFGSLGGVFSIDRDSGSTGSVPEPASWALMLGGFGMVGGAMRSRRRAAVTI